MKYLIILLSLFATTAYAGSYGQSLTLGSNYSGFTYSQPTQGGGYVETTPGDVLIIVKPVGDGWMRYNPNAIQTRPPRTWRQWETHRKNHILPHTH